MRQKAQEAKQQEMEPKIQEQHQIFLLELAEKDRVSKEKKLANKVSKTNLNNEVAKLKKDLNSNKLALEVQREKNSVLVSANKKLEGDVVALEITDKLKVSTNTIYLKLLV